MKIRHDEDLKVIALTIERSGVEEPPHAFGRQDCVHTIAEPVRQDQQEQRRHGERLRLEVVDLSEDTKTGRQLLLVTKRGQQCLRPEGGEA